MSSSQAIRSSKYSYRATSTGPGAADVNIEYIADLSSLSRLEVRRILSKTQKNNPQFNRR